MTATTRRTHVALWIVQWILAALFLFAGGMKLVTPLADLAETAAPLSAAFLKFIGLCEVAGALGLVLPGLLKIREGLTALAAAGLALLMVGAVILVIATHGVAPAATPFAVGVLAVVVARGRGLFHRRRAGESSGERVEREGR